MYVRQEAYYAATPDGAKLSRAEQIERGNIEQEARYNDDDSEDDEVEDLTDALPTVLLERQEIPMPDISPGSEYLVAFLHSAGTVTATGMGLVGISWQELKAWAECTDNVGIVTPRDMAIVHTLSRVYANEYSKASQKGAKPPYVEEQDIEVVREVVSQKAEDVFGALMAAQAAR